MLGLGWRTDPLGTGNVRSWGQHGAHAQNPRLAGGCAHIHSPGGAQEGLCPHGCCLCCTSKGHAAVPQQGSRRGCQAQGDHPRHWAEPQAPGKNPRPAAVLAKKEQSWELQLEPPVSPRPPCQGWAPPRAPLAPQPLLTSSVLSHSRAAPTVGKPQTPPSRSPLGFPGVPSAPTGARLPQGCPRTLASHSR